MKSKQKRQQITTTLSPEIVERLDELQEPLSKFLDHAIANELSRSASATSRLAEALHECIKAAVQDALAELAESKK